MKILAIDDQQLVLLSLEKKLTTIGYEVKTATSAKRGIVLYQDFQPDLVLLDMNMPENSGDKIIACTGLEVVKFIRLSLGHKTPIMVLSGNYSEKVIVENFHFGIDDYMKKPVGLDEMCMRIKRIIGTPKSSLEMKIDFSNQMIQKSCVGIVIPCYNEADRLNKKEFQNFALRNLSYHLCFVNDGSTDNTLEVLHKIRKENKDNISVYNCKENRGKAEAVRQGMLHLINEGKYDYLGYLDADLSTDFNDFDDLVKTLESSKFKIVSGSRINRMGADITKESARKIISKSINLIIQKILRMPFKDTQCGAKVMNYELAATMFKTPFVTKWLFDVEIFMRMRKTFGKKDAIASICEKPLKRWIHADGSKLSIKDSLRIIGQLAILNWNYR